jgi:hypothetical protein
VWTNLLLKHGQSLDLKLRDVSYPVIVISRFILDTRDKPALLFAMMRKFASEESRIAFEGNLSSTELFGLEGASFDEQGMLRRATVAPKLDFVVLPLRASRVPEVEKAIRSKIAFARYKGIVHVQIQVNGKIVFGAYDNFGRETVVVDGTVSTDLLEELVKDRTLRSYSPVPNI